MMTSTRIRKPLWMAVTTLIVMMAAVTSDDWALGGVADVGKTITVDFAILPSGVSVPPSFQIAGMTFFAHSPPDFYAGPRIVDWGPPHERSYSFSEEGVTVVLPLEARAVVVRLCIGPGEVLVEAYSSTGILATQKRDITNPCHNLLLKGASDSDLISIVRLTGGGNESSIARLSAILSTAPSDWWPVVLPPDAWTHENVNEGTILANRLLSGDEAELVFDEKALDMLADEIEEVLALVRIAYPETAGIVARLDHVWGRLVLTLSYDLADTVERLVKGQTEPVELRTGNEAFDRLNAELGVKAVVGIHGDTAEFQYGRTLNLKAAAERYTEIEGVSQAGPYYLVGIDGPDVYVEREGEGWLVWMVDAWGDCPSGCINGRTTEFLVEDGMVQCVGVREWNGQSLSQSQC